MMHRKRGTRPLGSLIAGALGAMAFATSAQAVAPGFLINKFPVGSLLATVGGVIEGSASMLVPGLNFQLICTAFMIDEGHLITNTDALGMLLYTGCTTLSISKFPEEIHCHVKEPIRAEALLLPAELTNGNPAILAEKAKALIVLHLPAPKLGEVPCPLPLDNTITGEICYAISNNDTVEPLIFTNSTVQCKERPSLEALSEGAGIKDVTKYGAQTITFDAASKLFLTGAHSGRTFGVSLY